MSSNIGIWRPYGNPLLTIGLLIAIELLDKTVLKIPSPAPIYLTVVVYAAFSGGLRLGLLSGAITLLYALYSFSIPGELFHYTENNLWCVIILAFTTPLIALMVGTLKQRLEQLEREQTISKTNIGEQNQTEVALRDALQKLTFHFENTPLAVIERDREFKITRWSQAAERIFGWKAEEVIGKGLEELQLVFVEDIETVKNIRSRLLSGLEKYNVSYNRTYKKDGSVIDCEWYNSALLDEAGKVVSVFSLVMDVTQRKRAEEELQAAHKRNITILESITDAFVAFDREWRYIYVNEEAARIFQKPREEILGQQLWNDLFPEAVDNIFYREFHRAVDEQIPIEFDGFSEQLNIWAEVHLYPISEGLAVYFRDISARKLAEEERNQLLAREKTARAQAEATAQALAESREQYRIMGETLPYGVWMCGPDGGARYVSQSFLDLLEMTTEEMQQFGWTSRLPPEDVEPMLKKWLDCVETGEFWDDELRILGPDGKYHTVLTRGRPVRDETGKITSWVGINLDIDDRKRMEEELREANRSVTNILESITDAFVALDHEWRITYVNQETARLNNMQPEEFIGKTNWEVWPWSVGTQVENQYRRAVAEQVAVHFEVLYEPLDMWLEIHAYPSVEGLSIYFRNITEKKRMEQTLALNRDRLDLVLQGTQLGLWYCDLPFDKLIWNDKCKEHFWLPLDTEVTIDIFYAQLHPDDRERTKAAIDLSIEQKRNYDIEYRTVSSEGQIHWVRAIGRGFYDASGNPIRFDGITVDVTERKRVEEERSRAEAREREHTQRLQRLAEASLAINSTLSLEEILKLITEQAREIIQVHQSVTSITIDDNWTQSINSVSLSDKYAQWRDYDEQTDGSGIYSLVAQMQRPMRMTQAELETHPAWHGFGKHADKHPPMRGWLAVPLTSREGKNIGLIQLSDKYEGEFTQEDEAILVQLAQMASTAIDNAQLYQESVQANRLKDEFLATLSHELRSPLNAMLGWLSLLRTRKFDEATKNRALETIERNARTQAQLIEDILDVSRIIRGQLALNVRPVQLTSVISSAIDIVQPAADAKNIQLQTILNPSAGPVSGDSDRLQQVVWNLLTNAVKFTPKDGSVEIRLERVNSHVEITVTDTGKGIEPDFLPYVFERFRQADSSITRSYGGLGLGLAIVRQLVELHGGTVKAESEGEGKGATFIVKLPLMAVNKKVREPEQVHPTVGERVSFDDSLTLQGLRVLVVDDEPDARELIVSILEECGAEAVAVASASEAIKVLKEQASRLDVLISDIGMPNEDGYSLLRQVRSLPREMGGQIPAVALTAYARTEDRKAALLAGFGSHLAKPVELAELIVVIANVTGTTTKE